MPRSSRPTRSFRAMSAALLALVALTLGGCGMNAQTLQSYTPANGVNIDDDFLKVRNLLIIADASGQGRLSASLVSQQTNDRLTGVAGTALKDDGTRAGALTVGTVNVDLPAGRMVVLTGPGVAPIAVSGGDLKPGLTAELSLTFANGSSRTIQVPVADAADPIFSSVTPLPTGSPTPASSPTGTASPTASPSPTTTP